MVRRVRNPSHHHPGSRPGYVEELDLLFPPGFVLRVQGRHSLRAVFCVAANELQSALRRRQRGCPDVNAQDVAKPQIFADTLMHHLLVNTPPPRIMGIRADRQILLPELAPYAQNLDPLGGISLDQEPVSHGDPETSSTGTVGSAVV